jgi:hypothetical protein
LIEQLIEVSLIFLHEPMDCPVWQGFSVGRPPMRISALGQ